MLRALACTLALTLTAGPVYANAKLTVLMDVLQIKQAIEIFREEGFDYAEELDAEFLNGQGGAFWRAQVQQIYDADRISEQIRSALQAGLSDAEITAAVNFFGSETGNRIVTLETAARRAMSDPDIEDAALEAYEEQARNGDPHFELVRAYIEVNDLIERNVSGAMSANFHFYKGLSDGKFQPRSEAAIIEEVWSQQDDIRVDSESWLFSLLVLAFQPVSMNAMQHYVDYSASSEGQALNAALFEGFDDMYRDVSYALGRAIALNAEGDEI